MDTRNPQVTPGATTTTTTSATTLNLGSIGSRRRAAVSLSDLRTPLVENIMSMLPSGHDKAFQYALYNVLAMILAGVCVAAFWAAYCILEPFIKPLMWALLCGSVIHPFKDRLVSFCREWLGMVKGSSTPLSLQLTFIPLRAVDSFSEGIGSRVMDWWKYIVAGLSGFFFTYLIYYNPPVTLGLILYWAVVFLFRSLLWIITLANAQFVVAVTVVYLGSIVHFAYSRSYVQPQRTHNDKKAAEAGENVDQADQSTTVDSTTTPATPSDECHKNGLLFRTLSVATWFLWFTYFCQWLPYPLVLIVMVSMLTGAAIYIRKRSAALHATVPVLSKCAAILSLVGKRQAGDGSAQSSRGVSRKASIQFRSRRNTHLTPSPGDRSGKDSDVSMVDADMPKIMRTHHTDVSSSEKRPDEFKMHDVTSSEIRRACIEPLPSPNESVFSEDEVDGLLDSNKFLYGVLCACLVVQVWHRTWLAHLLPIPVVYFGLKRLSIYLGFWSYVDKTFYKPFADFYSADCGPSRDLFPEPVRVLFRIIYEADRKFISIFESYLDMVATIIILVAVMVVSVIFVIFAATQFYAEGDHLVRVATNVINSTVSQYPEISEMLPEGWESLTDSLVGNAYHYGRDYIKTMIRDSVGEKNPQKGEEMEKHVIELLDRIYLSWNRTWSSIDNIDEGAKGLEWNDLVKTGQNVTNWFDSSMLVNYAKSNIGGLKSVLESLWTVFIGNVQIAVSAITAALSVLFGGGSAILNLIIDFIVFFTALFYLLSSSTSVYKPVEVFNAWFPGDGKHSSSFVSAIEESVSGVFSATLKMSAFYGMWTWLIHTLFQVNIVFVPSFFAAIFAAVPLLMPYWAAFPACLELWLIQGRWTKALFMLLAQMAPMSLVDAQIYSEIKGGGHPYLTALAVAGGIFYFGMQGAIMGPVVLCSVFVAVKIGSSYMKEGRLKESWSIGDIGF